MTGTLLAAHGFAIVMSGAVLADSSQGCPTNIIGAAADPGQAISCSVGSIIGNIVNFIFQSFVNFVNWLQTGSPPPIERVFGPAFDGDMSGLCQMVDSGAAVDCGGQEYATKLAPYATILGLCCWAWSVIRSLNDPAQTDLRELLVHVRRGLLMMAGVWLVYPAARFTWELSRVASNAMVFDINGGSGLVAPHVGTTGFTYPTPELAAFGLLVLLEMAFLGIWMVGATVAVLVGSVFGGFAVAVTPVSGLQGLFGRWLQFMSGFIMLRLLLPPISAVLLRIMATFTEGAHGATTLDAAALGLANLVIAVALLWVSGKAVQFLAQGVAGTGASVGGMLSVGQQYRGAAAGAARVAVYPARVAGRVGDAAASRSATYVGVKQKVASSAASAGRLLKP